MNQPVTMTEELPEHELSARSHRLPFLFVVMHCDNPSLGGARYCLSGVDGITIGRGPSREVSRVDEGGARTLVLRLPSPSVSKAHARLVRKGAAWFLEDLGSKNGSCVNGERVSRAPIQDGDLIEVGSVVLRHRAALPVSGDEALDLDSASRAPEVTGYMSLDPAIATDLAALARVARLPITTLLLGETGTGKEVLAKGMHALSGRRGPFVAVNCGALPSSLLESQLFGHVRGSFTGAQRDEPGYIRSAEGGTLFLDEIGDMPLHAQAALLRVLQEREVVPVGGARPTRVDVRVIAATNQPLDTLCLEGEFRTDLLARLSGYQHTLPPLRERIEDLGLLIGDLLRRSNIPGAPSARLSVRVARRLLSHTWPLNIRELENVLTVAVALAEGGVVELSNLPESVTTAPVQLAPSGGLSSSPGELREQLVSLLQKHQGNVSSVARVTGKSRMQIHRWMQKFGIHPDDFRG
ncbi:sigma 54-interacting transcriptional regulator [Polyangium spumosum]|nr:sigma 54-interacting transcriptional regulator [Polyangium spumosum]